MDGWFSSRAANDPESREKKVEKKVRQILDRPCCCEMISIRNTTRISLALAGFAQKLPKRQEIGWVFVQGELRAGVFVQTCRRAASRRRPIRCVCEQVF
jgi:hypothetical protein